MIIDRDRTSLVMAKPVSLEPYSDWNTADPGDLRNRKIF